MAMSGWSVRLATLFFMVKLDDAVTYNQYFVHILSLATDNKCIQVVSLSPSYNSVVAI